MRSRDAMLVSICLGVLVPSVCAQEMLPEAPTQSDAEASPESILREWEYWLRDTPEDAVRDAYEAKAGELVGRVDLGTLTPSSAARLAPLLMIGGEHLERVADRMGAFVDDVSSRGATAEAIRVWFTAEASKAPVPPLELVTLLKHPGLEAAVGEGADGAGYALFEMLAKQLALAGPEVMVRRAERVCELLKNADASLDTTGLIATAKVYLTLLDTAGLGVMGDAREHLLGVYREAERAMGETQAMQRSVMKQVIEAVEFIGGAAGDLDFSWTSAGFEVANLEQLRGRVVVIDFWATWCGPCIRAFPKVRQLQEHYKDSAVTIIGVTSLQGAHYGGGEKTDTTGNPELEYQLMAGLMKDLDVTWPVAFAEESKYGVSYRVMSIPHLAIIAPDGTLRANGLHPMMPDAEKHAIIDGILEEFGLEVPGE